MIAITFFLGLGTVLLGIGIEKIAPMYPGTHFIYAGLSIIILSLLWAGYKRFFLSETKKQIRTIHIVLHRNFKKWEDINNGVLKPKRKSEITEMYDEIKRVLQNYYDLIMDGKVKSSNLAKYEVMREFTKFPGAGIQPELFQKAKIALKEAFPKESKLHNE